MNPQTVITVLENQRNAATSQLAACQAQLIEANEKIEEQKNHIENLEKAAQASVNGKVDAPTVEKKSKK